MRQRTPVQVKEHQSLGAIRPDELYPSELFARRLGVGRKGLGEWRKQGLRVIQAGRRGYVLGQDALEFFRKLAESQR